MKIKYSEIFQNEIFIDSQSTVCSTVQKVQCMCIHKWDSSKQCNIDSTATYSHLSAFYEQEFLDIFQGPDGTLPAHAEESNRSCARLPREEIFFNILLSSLHMHAHYTCMYYKVAHAQGMLMLCCSSLWSFIMLI